tara:strand:+ start:2211 stop:3911 length:1701 start_codon:yes stop_codon:yes gene_type:complete
MIKLKTIITCFLFYGPCHLLAQYQDVWINEIYADQTPSFGMPNAEFLELKNNTTDTLDLNNWGLSDALDTVLLPIVKIPPLEYLILCKASAEPMYSIFGSSLGVPNLPSLNNAGDVLKIWNQFGVLIDSVTYGKEFYQEETDSLENFKWAGGYSLERLASTSLCGSIYNWLPSRSILGASPGKKNSVLNLNLPALDAQLAEVFIADDKTLQLIFTEELSAFSEQNMFLPDNVITHASLYSPNTVSALLAVPLIPNEYYTLSFSALNDCRGELFHIEEYTFFYYDEVQQGDVVINELLFNPHTGGVDFIELYNKSDKLILMEGFRFVEYDVFDTAEEIENKAIKSVQIEPGEYHVFASDTANIIMQYRVFEAKWLHENSIPNMPDDEGIIVVQFPDGRAMDSMCYRSSWHLASLDYQDGVTLERIHSNLTTNNQANWHSAARSYGHGTPTAENSQSGLALTEGGLSVYPKVFTPNQDGQNDYCSIQYQSDNIGQIGNLSIYDIQGRQIRLLAQNHSLGKTNTWLWEGLNNTFEKVSTGIYFVLLEVHEENGRTRALKKLVVLGAMSN